MSEVLGSLCKKIKRSKFYYYVIKCSCGIEYIANQKNYNAGKSQVCKACANKNRRGKHKGIGDLSRGRYFHMKQKAKERGYEFNVSMEYIWELFVSQDKRCALTGLEITLNPAYKRGTNGDNQIDWGLNTASLDRIDSNLGYIEGNLQFVHKDINRMKQHFTEDYFIHMCSLVYAHSLPSLPNDETM